MIKKIFLIIGLLFSLLSAAQFPPTTSVGSNNTTYVIRGVTGIDTAARFITNYVDTAALNRGVLKQVPRVMAMTTGNLLWVRSDDATKWNFIGGGTSGGNIYTNNGTLLSDRTVTGANYFLKFNGLSSFNVTGLPAGSFTDSLLTYNAGTGQFRRMSPSSITGPCDVSITVSADSLSLYICDCHGSCDTVTACADITPTSSIQFTSDTTYSICTFDTATVSYPCDTCSMPRQNVAIYQNWVYSPSRGILEFGSSSLYGAQLQHNTYANTYLWKMNWQLATVEDYGHTWYNYHYTHDGTGLVSWLHRGYAFSGQQDYNNTVQLGVNFTSRLYPDVTSRPGYFGYSRLGYFIGPNATGHGPWGLRTDNPYRKVGGIFINTDSAYTTEALSIYGIKPPLQTYIWPPATLSTATGDTAFIATFHNNKTVTFRGYGDGIKGGTAAYLAGWDSDGNFVETSGSGSFWGLTGNAVTNGQRIGTTNNRSFRGVTNDVQRFSYDSLGNYVQGLSDPVTDGIYMTNTIRSATTSTKFILQNSSTGSTNGDGLNLIMLGANAYLNNFEAGGGLYFGTVGSTRWQVDASGHFLTTTDNTYDIGASGATRPRNIYTGTLVTSPAFTKSAATTGAITDSIVVRNPSTGIYKEINTNYFATASSISGTANQVAYFTGTNVIGGSANMTFTPANNHAFLAKGTSGGGMYIGSYPAATYGMIWSSEVTPSATNYAMLASNLFTIINTPSGTNLLFRENDASRMIINSGGNVSIGSTNNTYKFDVTGTALVSTSLQTPLVYGGTTTTSPLTYKTTTGVGTTGADHIFQVGNNGATELMRGLNSGNLVIGATAMVSNERFRVVNTGSSMIAAMSNAAGDWLMGMDAAGGYFQPITATRGFWFYNSAGTSYMGVAGSGGVGINTTSPAASSALDITSTTKGILIPRMTGAQRTAISSPDQGLLAYQTGVGTTSAEGMYGYIASNWRRFLTDADSSVLAGSSGSAWLKTGNAGTTAGTNFIGTTDNIDFVMKRNSVEGLRLTGAMPIIHLETDPLNTTRRKIEGGNIAGTLDAEGMIYFATGGTPTFEINAGDNNKFLLANPDDSIVLDADNAIGFNISGSQKMVLNNSGYLGIGVAPTSKLHVVDNTVTTGIGAAFSSSSLTSGTLMDLTRTGTAAAANNEVLNISSSGANATNDITVTGGRISVTNTNVSGGTNVGLDVTATGATTVNYALKLVDGSQGNGKILTSDASGFATWATQSVPTLQQVLTSGSTLTTNNTINIGSGNTFIVSYPSSGPQLLVSSSRIELGSNTTPTYKVAVGGFGIQMAANSANSGFIVTGLANFTDLDRVMGQRSANGNFGYLNLGTGVAITTGTLNTTNTTDYVAKTGTYTAVAATDATIECTANTFTVTLPTAVGITGKIFNIANSGAGVITIATTSSQTFVNVVATPTTLTLSAVGTYQVQSNGANWLVLSSN